MLYQLSAADIFHTFDTATTGVDITDNITHVSSGIVTSTFMIGSTRIAPALCIASFESHGTGNVERHLRGVNLMVGTVVYGSVNAQYRESAKDTGFA